MRRRLRCSRQQRQRQHHWRPSRKARTQARRSVAADRRPKPKAPPAGLSAESFNRTEESAAPAAPSAAAAAAQSAAALAAQSAAAPAAEQQPPAAPGLGKGKGVAGQEVGTDVGGKADQGKGQGVGGKPGDFKGKDVGGKSDFKGKDVAGKPDKGKSDSKGKDFGGKPDSFKGKDVGGKPDSGKGKSTGWSEKDIGPRQQWEVPRSEARATA